MYDIIKHYKVLVLGLAFILWATLLAAAVLNLYNKNKRKSYSKDIENAITTVYEDAEFIENGSDSGTFITAKNVSTESRTEKLNVTYIQIQMMLKLNLLI